MLKPSPVKELLASTGPVKAEEEVFNPPFLLERDIPPEVTERLWATWDQLVVQLEAIAVNVNGTGRLIPEEHRTVVNFCTHYLSLRTILPEETAQRQISPSIQKLIEIPADRIPNQEKIPAGEAPTIRQCRDLATAAMVAKELCPPPVSDLDLNHQRYHMLQFRLTKWKKLAPKNQYDWAQYLETVALMHQLWPDKEKFAKVASDDEWKVIKDLFHEAQAAGEADLMLNIAANAQRVEASRAEEFPITDADWKSISQTLTSSLSPNPLASIERASLIADAISL